MLYTLCHQFCLPMGGMARTCRTEPYPVHGPYTDIDILHARSIIQPPHHIRGGVTPVASVLPSATGVKIKVNGQLEIFFIVNSQATISL